MVIFIGPYLKLGYLLDKNQHPTFSHLAQFDVSHLRVFEGKNKNKIESVAIF